MVNTNTYYRPETLARALELLSREDITVYAGGTDLMISPHEGEVYMFTDKIPELRRITDDGEYIRIGAGCTFAQALESGIVPPLMKAAVSKIGAPAVRNMGTFGGNIANGSAKADSVLVEFACDAKLVIASVRGERVVDIDKFYFGRKKLDLARDELITQILLPNSGLENWYYEKVGARESLTISRVSFAGIFAAEDGKITKAAAAFGAVAATVLRFRDIEAMLLGKTISEARLIKPQVLEAYSRAIVPVKGRVSGEYRHAVCMNLLNDFLTKNGI